MGYTVLIADDETMPRTVLRQNLPWAELGVDRLLEACDGREAVEQARAGRPQIIISDIKMPRKNGLEMAAEVRGFLPRCQFIFLSGYSDKEYLKGAIRLKAVSYVEKPIDLDEMTAALRDALGDLARSAPPDPAEVFFRGPAAGGPPRNDKVYTCSHAQITALGGLLRKGERGMLHAELGRMYDELCRCEATDPEYIRHLYRSITFLFLRAAEAHSLSRLTARSDQLLYNAACQQTAADLWQALYELEDDYFAELDAKAPTLDARVEQFLQQNYRNSALTVQDIAYNLNFTHTYLCAAYKKTSGKTINRRLTEIRMHSAARLLAETDMKLYEIARAVGYTDGKYFVKLFTRETGATPREYREGHAHAR